MLRNAPLHIRRLLATLPLLQNLLDLLILIVVILPGVRNLVFKYLDELVEANGYDGAGSRADPVDPVLCVEDASYDTRPERACGIEGTAGVVDAD
jgi:hypothetical protein